LHRAATLVPAKLDGTPRGQGGEPREHRAAARLDVGKNFGLLTDGDVLVEQAEFRQGCERLAAAGYRLRDEEQAWRDFCRLRAEYSGTLNSMAQYWAITPATWIGDRSPIGAARHS